MKLEQLFEKYAVLSGPQRIEEGKEALKKLEEEMGKLNYNKKEIISFAVSLARLSAGADNFASEKEYDLLVKVSDIEITKFEFFDMVKNADKEDFIASMDDVVDSLARPAKDAALTIVALFLSVDSKLSEEEKVLFDRLEA